MLKRTAQEDNRNARFWQKAAVLAAWASTLVRLIIAWREGEL